MDFGGFGGTWIWKHYTKLKVMAKCIHCGKKFSPSDGMDTLFDHARSVHGYLPPVNQHENKSSETSDEAIGTVSCKDGLERNASHKENQKLKLSHSKISILNQKRCRTFVSASIESELTRFLK